MPRPFKHDQWAPLSYTSSVGDGTSRPPGARTWLDDDDARRIAVYERLAAKLDNVDRFYLPDYLWEKPLGPDQVRNKNLLRMPAAAEKHREYGDPAHLVMQARSFVLGDEQTAVIPDATPLSDEEAKDDALKAEQARAEIFADWLDEWIEQEQLWLRLLEGEELSIGLSDAVYEIVWDDDDAVPRIEVHDPGFYFPVLTGPQASKSGRYPNRVHLAWEEVDQESGIHWLYRKTYSREKLPGEETRRYEYLGRDDPASRWTVYYSFGRWDLSKTKDGVYDLAESAGDYRMGNAAGVEQRRVDLNIDFVPVVHVPNDAAGRRHFGRSLLLRVAQILDELADTDTDLAANSADLGSPPVVTSGAGASGGLAVGAGAQWSLPAGADAKLLDTSKALDAQIKYVDHLLHRLSRNTRLAQSLLGDIQPDEVPSGYAFQLGHAPTTNLIREMRMVRNEKLPLIPRFAMRMAQQFKVGTAAPALPAGRTPRAEIRLGPFLPADKTGAVERVTKALKDHAISTLTAVQELIEDGWAIEDAEEEVARIQSENFEAAVRLLEAVGREDIVFDYLGIDVSALDAAATDETDDEAGAGEGDDGTATGTE